MWEKEKSHKGRNEDVYTVYTLEEVDLLLFLCYCGCLYFGFTLIFSLPFQFCILFSTFLTCVILVKGKREKNFSLQLEKLQQHLMEGISSDDTLLLLTLKFIVSLLCLCLRFLCLLFDQTLILVTLFASFVL